MNVRLVLCICRVNVMPYILMQIKTWLNACMRNVRDIKVLDFMLLSMGMEFSSLSSAGV